MKTTKVKASARSGYLALDTLKLGEYTFGNMGDTTLVRIKKNQGQNEAVKIYPNPAHQKCTIELQQLTGSGLLLKLCNAEGRILNTRKLSERITILDLSAYPKGVYFIAVENGSGVIGKQKLVID